jgi:hypothetical protein
MHCMKFLVVLLGLVLVGVYAGEVRAQDSTAIEYGKAVIGEVTDAGSSIKYTFTAEANDVVVIRMKQEGSGSSVSPHVVLLDSSGNTIADTKDQVAIYSVNVAAQLTDAGEYTITANSADEKSTGKFELALSKATVLEPGTAMPGKGSSESYNYYTYTSDSPFTLQYEKHGGDFAPTIAVNRVDEKHEMRSVALLSGEQVGSGTIGVRPKQKELYIVSVGEGTFDLNFQPVTADYTLTLTSNQ